MRIERLTPNHNASGFECGVKELNDWLSIHSQENQRRNISRTFVVVEDADEVVGYYTLSMGGVQANDLPPKLRGGLPRYDIGMVLLGRLALARPLHGRGLGRDLMIDAIVRAATAGKSAAVRFIAVDPIDESARKFYVKFGFQEIEGDERGRMYLRIDEALLALGLSEDTEVDT